ncbi:MAG: glycerate kinase [Candidatus Cyclobacteriaceae bacterium M2_1C_046]
MRILIAPDKFKHSLSAIEVAKCISKGIKERDESIEIIERPLSDGGEGFVDTIVKAREGRLKKITAFGPREEKIASQYGIIENNTAVIEMALASGIELLDKGQRDPTKTTTFGTGELIKDAIKSGNKKIIIGIGGSATNDGGTGMARALGFKFLDKTGNEIKNVLGLRDLEEIEFPQNYGQLVSREIIVASDVKNKLLGEKGSSRIYGPQKGAGPEQVVQLEGSLLRLAEVAKGYSNQNYADLPGSGAAGGLGFGILFFLKGEMRSGFEIVQELTGLENEIKGADIIITGEGKLDEQSLSGKTPIHVANLAQKHNKKVIVICGDYDRNFEQDFNVQGITKIYSLADYVQGKEKAIEKAAELLQKIAKDIKI